MQLRQVSLEQPRSERFEGRDRWARRQRELPPPSGAPGGRALPPRAAQLFARPGQLVKMGLPGVVSQLADVIMRVQPVAERLQAVAM